MKDWVGRYFPAYSPDFNGPIEKCWRECQKRVLARASEINGRADMMRVVKEEWEGLEFEKTEHWCGINHLVENVPLALKNPRVWREQYVKGNGWWGPLGQQQDRQDADVSIWEYDPLMPGQGGPSNGGGSYAANYNLSTPDRDHWSGLESMSVRCAGGKRRPAHMWQAARPRLPGGTRQPHPAPRARPRG